MNDTSDIRFEFGKNWRRFLGVLDEKRVEAAEESLRAMLGVQSLRGKSFLDAGCGSGLFSLAAMRCGSARVHSFDYDEQSVMCGRELKRRYFSTASEWVIEQGDVLNREYLSGLGKFDVVYSWGVLHHTGNLWQAMENAAARVDQGGMLFIAIYNDQGWTSRCWTFVKKLYNGGAGWRYFIVGLFLPAFLVGGAVVDLGRRRNPVQRYRDYRKLRGMSYLYDLLDWLGGYPFEVASREKVLAFLGSRGFGLRNLKSCGGKLGNNEFVMVKRGE